MVMENNVPVTLTGTAVAPERTPDVIAEEIRTFTAAMLNNAIEIGRRMVEAKEMLPYGRFGAWITENTGYSVSAANNFMRLFDEYGAAQGSLFGATADSQTFGKLSPSKALALLAVPAEEREAFAVESDAEHTSVRELKRKIEEYRRERDEALQKAEAAENDNDELRKDNTDLSKRVKELEDAPPDELLFAEMREEARAEAVAEYQGKLEEAETARAKAQAEESGAKRREADLRQELEDAKKARETEIAAARAEAAEELQAKLDAANVALDEANAAAQAASESESKLRQELSEARKARSETTFDKDIAKDIATFELLFNQIKENANKMREILLKSRENGDNSTADKLSRIMIALAVSTQPVHNGRDKRGANSDALDILRTEGATSPRNRQYPVCKSAANQIIADCAERVNEKMEKVKERFDAFLECCATAGVTVRRGAEYVQKSAVRLSPPHAGIRQGILPQTHTSAYFCEAIIMWRDYLSDAQRLRYDLTRDDVRTPRNLLERHDAAAATVKAEEDAAQRKKYGKLYAALQLRYEYGADGLKIVVPSCARDIVDEGRTLHHCVGGYAARHLDGKLAILFLRREEAPDTPYVTIEMNVDNNPAQLGIRQIHGYRNDIGAESPRETHKEFLDKWLAWVHKGSPRNENGTPSEGGRRIKVPAQ